MKIEHTYYSFNDNYLNINFFINFKIHFSFCFHKKKIIIFSNNHQIFQISNFEIMLSAFTISLPLINEGNEIYSIKRIIQKDDKNKMDAKRESKNRDAFQQSFLIGKLVECGYQITINRLYKRGNITHQMFTIDSISKNGINQFLETQKIIEEHKYKEKRQYLDAETNECLINLLKKEEFTIEERKTRKVVKEGSIAMQRIASVYYNGKFYGNTEIMKIGCFYNQIIKNKISTKNGVTLLPFDPIFNSDNSDNHINESSN